MSSNQLILSICSLVALIITLVFNYTSTAGLIGSDQKTLADKYDLEITPPGVTFSIWGIIYAWQFVWLIYVLVLSSCNLNQSDTVLFGTAFYVSWIFSCAFNGSWIVLFSFEYITISSLVLFFLSGTLYLSGYKAHQYIGYAAAVTDLNTETQTTSDKSNLFPQYVLRSSTIALIRGTVLNGIAFYATWSSIATCLGVAMFLAYPAGMDSNTACLIALGVLTAILVVYQLLDLYFFRSWLFYTYSPYAVLLWALSWITTNPQTGDKALVGATRNWVYILIALTAATLVTKIGLANFLPPQEISVKDVPTSGKNSDASYNVMEEL